jgi:D-3-phosphoglycerate dehydrogenase
MSVIGYDPMVNAPTVLDGRVRMCPDFDTLIGQVDVVSFHVPLNDATAGMLSRPQFERARPGLLVVNAARGGVVDEDALLEALEQGRCGGAAIDVFPQEPPPADSPLRRHPRVLCTPHLGASTVEAQEAVAVDACRVLLDYLQGRGLEGAVNAGGLRLDLSDRQQAFADLAQRMVMLLHAATGGSGMSEVVVTVRGEGLAGRADAIGRLALAALLRRHLDQPVNVINAALVAEERGIGVQTLIAADHGEDRLSIEICHQGERHRVDGAILSDGLRRVTHLDGYGLDMVPAGPMVLLTNTDEPGRIGLVGRLFGDAGVNIAEMVIGRKHQSGRGTVAMMILKLDDAPPASLLDALRAAPGILGVASVTLPGID